MSKLGTFFKNVAKVAPLILSLTPLAPIAEEVTAFIQEAEAIKGSGPEKLAHVKTMTLEAAKAINDQTGREVVSLDYVAQTVDNTVSVIVSATNIPVKAVPSNGN